MAHFSRFIDNNSKNIWRRILKFSEEVVNDAKNFWENFQEFKVHLRLSIEARAQTLKRLNNPNFKKFYQFMPLFKQFLSRPHSFRQTFCCL